MRTTMIPKACALICALSFGAGVNAAENPASEHNMTGCLAAGSEAGTFRLTDLGLAGGPTTVEIAEASTDLAPHVGHKVEITGSTVSGADAATHTMKVTAIKHLAATCPE